MSLIMEVSVAQVKQQLDNHETHCNERHQVIDTALTRLSADVIRLTSDVENIKTNMTEMREDMRVLRGEMATLRSDVDNRIESLRSEVRDLRSEMRWMLGAAVGFLTLAIVVSTYIIRLPV